MKDLNEYKNYRTKYKRFYNIEFGSDYVIHHIDENRSNNDIENLLLLPLELHSKYHTYKNAFNLITIDGMCFNLSYAGSTMFSMQLSYLDDYVKVWKQIQQWIEYKYLADNGYTVYPMFERYE